MALFKPKRRSGGQFYQAVGNYQGCRVRHSLGTADYVLARELCTEFEHKVLTGQVTVGAQRSTLGSQNKFKTIAKRYLKSPMTGASKSTRAYVMRLSDHFGDFQIKAIDLNDIEEYVEERHVNRGNSNSTIRRDLTQLQSILNYATGLGLRDAIKLKKPAEGAHRTDTFSQEEIDIIFSQLHPDVRRICTFLLNTGARPIEAMTLQYDEVDFTNNTCLLGCYKGRGGILRTRRMPLNELALGVIPRSVPPPSAHVFLSEGRPFENNKQISYHWRKVTDKLGISKPPYTLRHTFATRLARNGTPPKVIADLLGHSDLKMVMRYMNTTYEDHLSAVMSLQ
jgi:integrase